MANQIDLADLAQRWEISLMSSQYAGEVVIPESDLPDLAAAIRRDLFSPRQFDSTKTALLALAVNCMYYYHDEQGFWIHFCRLLDVSEDPPTQSWLGGIIEDQLLRFGFLDQVRFGPFRYVTPLREQTGITRREIGRYAVVLQTLASRYGWAGIRSLPRDSFDNQVEKCLQTGHLCRFLQEDSGWRFTTDVA